MFLLGIVAQAFNPSPWEVEAGRSPRVCGQPEVHRKKPYLKKRKNSCCSVKILLVVLIPLFFISYFFDIFIYCSYSSSGHSLGFCCLGKCFFSILKNNSSRCSNIGCSFPSHPKMLTSILSLIALPFIIVLGFCGAGIKFRPLWC